MKKPRRRTPKHKVNKRQRALAIKTLEAALISPDTPPHALVSAGRALLSAGREVEDDAESPEDAGPQSYIILPDNSRNANVRCGLYDERQTVVIVPSGYPLEVQPEVFYDGGAHALPALEGEDDE